MVETQVVRKTATGAFFVAVLLMVLAAYIGLVYHGDLDAGAKFVASLDFVFWVLILGSGFGAILLLLLILLVIPTSAAAPTTFPTIAVKCKECGNAFDVEDPGSRPLLYNCPVCATEGHIEAPPEEATTTSADTDWTPPTRAAQVAVAPSEGGSGDRDALVETLVVRCTNCSEEFELPYSARRPLTGTCPACGREAVLEADLDVGAPDGLPVIDLEGIGPAYASKLEAAGITTTEQLRAADAAELGRRTEIPAATIRTWQAMADLTRLDGIGKQYAEVLARTGIGSIPELAAETPTHLVSRIEEYVSGRETPIMGTGVDERRARRWIRAAREFRR